MVTAADGPVVDVVDGADDSEKRRFMMVLHTGVMDSLQTAVEAAIVEEYKERG